jgi:hypothetical protein
MASTQGETHITVSEKIKLVLLPLCCAALASCGGGTSTSGGGSLDPLVEDFGIAYVKQSVPQMDTEDAREVTDFTPGADLIFRDLASPGANERDVTRRLTGGLGDVKDVEVSYDGSKLLFALRMPDDPNAMPPPTWNIWEYDIASDTLTRVIASDTVAEDGEDIAPHYLPDGRIIFSSTRQRTSKAILLDESLLLTNGKPQFSALDESRNEPAAVLHVMDANGDNIEQITFNQSHDLDPVVLENGDVVFSRWDNMGNRNGIHLYKMYPDGTNLRLLYGANSHDTGTNGAIVQFLQPREMPNSDLLTLLHPATGTFQGGDAIAIETDNYLNNVQPTAQNLGVLTGPAQVSVAANPIQTDLQPSTGGRFNAFYPLWDGTNRALVSWSQCRLQQGNLIVPCTSSGLNDPNVQEAPPLYGVYVYDMDDGTQVPVFTPREGTLYRDVVAAQPRTLPQIIFDQGGTTTSSFDFDPTLIGENVGILNIRSVYDFDGTYNALGGAAADIGTMANPVPTPADQRPARFLRIVKAVGIPDNTVKNLNGANFGVSQQQLMREIIGYAPIEPDGSVRVKVPANIPFAISVLDSEGKRITARHQNWLQVRPGEILNCQGCHDPNSGVSHGREDAFTGLYGGAPGDNYVFPNTMEPASPPTGQTAAASQTMAEYRTTVDPQALDLSVDIHYADVWTADPIVRAMNAPLDYQYDALDMTMTAPVDSSCWNNWAVNCRIIINYVTHIHPLWSLDRGGVACTDCHTNVDVNNANADRVPDGQLDLSSDDPSDQNANHYKAYRELFFGDNAEELDMNGDLVDEQATDAMGNPLFALDANGNPDPNQPIFVRAPGPSMRSAGALASSRFFDRFSDAGDADHFNLLSAAELKLLAEWLDIGGQYYNNPFDVP